MEKPENRPLFAVPIMDEYNAVSKAREAMAKGADLIEFRLDCMQNPPPIEDIVNPEFPAIITNRIIKEGGKIKIDEDKRIKRLQDAIYLGAAYIDIELNSFHKFDRQNSKTGIIVSYHNLNETPPIKELHKIYSKAIIQEADIFKIVTMAKGWDDCIGIIDLVRDANIPTIGINMGKYGAVTRYNKKNYITFCALNKKECSAPGQFTLDYMINHFKQIEELHNKNLE